jgi:c-di-GMP-binding flagellar brake protein YcgR
MNERQVTRQALNPELTGEVSVYRPLAVSDLSASGARIESGDALRVGSIRAIRLNLGDRTVVLKGRIMHASVRTLDDSAVLYTAGVAFLDVPPPVRRAIEQFLARVDPSAGSDVG